MQKKPVTSLFLPARQFPGVRNKRVEKYQCSAIYLYTFICVVIYIVAADQRNFIVNRHTSSRTWGVIRERGITLRLVKSIKRCGPSYISFEHNLKVMWLMTYIQLAQMMFALIITPKIRVVSSFVIFFYSFFETPTFT